MTPVDGVRSFEVRDGPAHCAPRAQVVYLCPWGRATGRNNRLTRDSPASAPRALEAWEFVRQILDDMTTMIQSESESDLELFEGLRVLGRITALCSELSLDTDPEVPWFFSMNTEARLVGGPNPDGEYHLAMVDGRFRYRIAGNRNTVTYLGFQVLAGRGLTPRRMAAYHSDRCLETDESGSFALVLATEEPTTAELSGATWIPIPEDASAVLVRQYVADRSSEELARFSIEPLDPVGCPATPTDDQIAEQFSAMGWTIVKLMTLHKSIMPELLEQPNRLTTAEAASLGDENTTPDNLYMLGTFRLAEGEALVLEFNPPTSRYWSVTVENIWHECIDSRRRRSSITNATASYADADYSVRLVIGANDPGPTEGVVQDWLDTGGRHRGFVTLRWLDNPEPPNVRTSVIAIEPA